MLTTQHRQETHFVQADLTIGSLIAGYRHRKRNPHTGRPWSQEELAFASGTDQAHVSRLEKNLKHPQYCTLIHICDALELSSTERAQLLNLAGYLLGLPLPSTEEAETVVDFLASYLNTLSYPALLLDEGERVWDLNPLYATVLGICSLTNSYDGCLAKARGKGMVELVFDPDDYEYRLAIWKKYFDDLDYVLNRYISLFWRSYRLHVHDIETEKLVAHLRKNPDFSSRWANLERGQSNVFLTDHAAFTVQHPTLGKLQLFAWRTRVASDERFIVVHFTPADSETAKAFSRARNTG
jgi:transcriptional regulator with XRE-family HTH domain